jgi:hypothetical protein
MMVRWRKSNRGKRHEKGTPQTVQNLWRARIRAELPRGRSAFCSKSKRSDDEEKSNVVNIIDVEEVGCKGAEIPQSWMIAWPFAVPRSRS